MNLKTILNIFFKIKLSLENTICLFIFNFTSLLSLILVQEGSAYCVDAGIYLNYIEHFLKFNFIFNVDSVFKFSFGYPLVSFPFIFLFKNIIWLSTTSFAFRLFNILAFSASSVLIYKLANLFTRKRYAMLAALFFVVSTPAIPIAIDLWPQNITVLVILLILFSSFKFFESNKIIFFIINIISVACLYYIRNFELLIILPSQLIVLYTIFKKNKSNKKRFFYCATFIVIFLILISPYLYYNNLFFGNFLGYYASKSSTDIHDFGIQNLETLKFRLNNIFFNYSIDEDPDNYSFKPILSIFQSSPILILAFYGIFLSLKKKFKYTVVFLLTFFICSSIYISFHYWVSFWAPAQRFFLPIFPILCIWSVIAIEKIFTNIKKNVYFFSGLITSAFIAIFTYYLFKPFFLTMIMTNLGMWSNRFELKYFSISLYIILLILYLIYLLFQYLNKNNILNFLKGMFIPVIGIAIGQGFFANAIAAAASIRYGNNVFPFFAKIKFFNYFGDYIAYGVNYESPTSYKILFTIILIVFFLTARKLIISRILIKNKADL